jgi:Spy/CpxP family protein refolding chaperone
MTTSTRRAGYAAGIATVLAVAALIATAASAGPGHPHRGGSFSKLELSDETRAAIRDAHEQARPASKELREKLRLERATLRELLDADAPDVSAVRQQIANIGAVRTEIEQHRMETRLQALALLTGEQRQQLREARKEMRERRGKGRRGRHRHGDE